MSRIDELIDELEHRLASLTPDEQRDLADTISRAARSAGVTIESAMRTLVELSQAFCRYAPRPDQQCQSPETRPAWYVRGASRWPCLALPPRFGEGFCAAALKVDGDPPI